MLGLCKQVTLAVSNGVGWEPRNGNSDSNTSNRDRQQFNMGHIHQAVADNKHQPDGSVTSTEIDVGFSQKYLNNNGANGAAVHIDIPNNVNVPLSPNEIIPQEKFKTFVGNYLNIVS